VNFPNARPSRPERRTGERRSGAERRAQQRRAISDRRYAADRRGNGAPRLNVETPIEHIRNAMQMLVAASDIPVSPPAVFAQRIEAILERLTRALSALEQERRR
jgi:hypothetical protein